MVILFYQGFLFHWRTFIKGIFPNLKNRIALYLTEYDIDPDFKQKFPAHFQSAENPSEPGTLIHIQILPV